jgi:hypothetical protein
MRASRMIKYLLEKCKRNLRFLQRRKANPFNADPDIDFVMHFCFFSIENAIRLERTGEKKLCMKMNEFLAFVDVCELDIKDSDSLNIVSDYLLANLICSENKQVLIDLRSAGWDPLLASLFKIYAHKIKDLVQSYGYQPIKKVNIYFMIRPCSNVKGGFANTCFTVDAENSEQDGNENFKFIIESFIREVTP